MIPRQLWNQMKHFEYGIGINTWKSGYMFVDIEIWLSYVATRQPRQHLNLLLIQLLEKNQFFKFL